MSIFIQPKITPLLTFSTLGWNLKTRCMLRASHIGRWKLYNCLYPLPISLRLDTNVLIWYHSGVSMNFSFQGKIKY